MIKSKVIQFLLCVLGGLLGFFVGTFVQGIILGLPNPAYVDSAIVSLRITWAIISSGLVLAVGSVGAVAGFELVRAWLNRK